MRRTKIILLRELLVTQMNFWALFPVMLTLFILSGVMQGNVVPVLIWCLMLSLLPFALYFLRQYVMSPGIFMTLHIGIIVFLHLVLAGSGMIRFASVGMGIVFIVNSIYLRLRFDKDEDKAMPPIGAVLIAGVCFFLLQNQGLLQWKGLICFLLILVLCLYFLIYYIEKYMNFLSVNEGSAGHIPEKEIFRSGMKLALGYTVLGALILFLTADITWLNGITDLLKKVLIAFVSIVIYLFMSMGKPMELQYQQSGQGGGPLFPNDSSESFWLWDALTVIALLAIGVGITIAAYKGIRSAIHYLHGNWEHKFQETQTAQLSDDNDRRERLQTDGIRKKRGRLLPRFLSINERVRRLYQKQALRLGTEADQLRRMTARECAGRLQMPVLGETYEKARYSGQECTTAELRRMKAECKTRKES
ncbi:MAG: DUF4129 domain-containing protein [Acetatifactor sp.]|nr:DUF4129 domain-containing protein [Acetatifactor sp.]